MCLSLNIYQVCFISSSLLVPLSIKSCCCSSYFLVFLFLFFSSLMANLEALETTNEHLHNQLLHQYPNQPIIIPGFLSRSVLLCMILLQLFSAHWNSWNRHNTPLTRLFLFWITGSVSVVVRAKIFIYNSHLSKLAKRKSRSAKLWPLP